MAKRKLNYRFHNPNPVEVTADYILKVMIEAILRRWRRYCRRIWYRKEYGILKLKIYINIGEKWIYRNG